ncbi:uncharacterized protein LOC136087070 [Hydra vulgaris]|uniref:Uncharacterized protein LOC136087070 n=1 Tax=Hydra vulgaris TaxID=6087 RepID=A0ABM4CUQ3_HYDVU
MDPKDLILMGLKDLKWTDKLANELHRPVVKHFKNRKVIVNRTDEILATDLVDMKSFSKLNDERKCQKMWVDKGLEFYNKYVKALGVELYSTENQEKSCVVKRWNRIMKDKMFNYFPANSTGKYINVLDEMVNKYNNAKHSSIKMTPVEASDKKNENIVWLDLNRNVRSESEPKFSIGDRVKIVKKKFGFKFVRSAEHAHPARYIFKAFDKEKYTRDKFIDLSEAFDKVNH